MNSITLYLLYISRCVHNNVYFWKCAWNVRMQISPTSDVCLAFVSVPARRLLVERISAKPNAVRRGRTASNDQHRRRTTPAATRSARVDSILRNGAQVLIARFDQQHTKKNPAAADLPRANDELFAFANDRAIFRGSTPKHDRYDNMCTSVSPSEYVCTFIIFVRMLIRVSTTHNYYYMIMPSPKLKQHFRYILVRKDFNSRSISM